MTYPSRILRVAAAAYFGLAAGAWVRPQAPVRSALVEDQGSHLDYLIVRVNSESRVLRAGEELTVVRGDRVTIQDVAVKKGAPYKGLVNVVGFQRADKREDRGLEIDTSKDLIKRWSESERGDVYAIVAESGSKRYGQAYLRLIEPVLRYAEISVNGAARVLRDGETTTIAADDKVKVEKIVTNLADDGDVYFQIVENDGNGASGYEIRFLRGQLVFAKIPLNLGAPGKATAGDVSR